MSECTHNCETCSSNCSSKDLKQRPHDLSQIKKVIGVVSGKGGVGKSLITGLSASWANRSGYKTAVLDADITGPSIPKMFGLHERAQGSEFGLLPVETKSGIKVMSLNLLLNNESDPVVWRGPVIAGTVQQFWTDVIWGDIDFMFVDMPPGTGDVPLTVFQSIPVDAIIVVTSPQELVSLIVEKALNMANLMNVPVLGIVENMSYIECPDCGKKINVFGESKLDDIAAEKNIDILGRIPIVPSVAAAADSGNIESVESDKWIEVLEQKLKGLL
ncbi:MAG: Mrp/NBP35 family ATP-binding protein [Clostridia bacterium]|nr:Mrp/NBP35 family ATP-binding protein [Clostridia bacterium]